MANPRRQRRGSGSTRSPSWAAYVAGLSLGATRQQRSITSSLDLGAPGTSIRSHSVRSTTDSVLTGFDGPTLLEAFGKVFMAVKNPSLPWYETWSSKGNRGVLFQVMGQPYSKANSRQLLRGKGGKPIFAKSPEALEYASRWAGMAPRLDFLLEGRVRVYGVLCYASERPDLDESLILDLAQGCVIKNDRQVREKFFLHAVDTEMPRAVLLFEESVPGQLKLDLDSPST